MREIERLEERLQGLDEVIGVGEALVAVRVERVSAWSVAQQVDHCLNVLRLSIERLAKAEKPLSRPINLLGRTLLLVGRLPRGRGRAPKGTEGRERTAAELSAALAEVRAALAALAADEARLADPTPYVPHPYFGGLTTRQSLRMLDVHTAHHLRIVADIRRAAERG